MRRKLVASVLLTAAVTGGIWWQGHRGRAKALEDTRSRHAVKMAAWARDRMALASEAELLQARLDKAGSRIRSSEEERRSTEQEASSQPKTPPLDSGEPRNAQARAAVARFVEAKFKDGDLEGSRGSSRLKESLMLYGELMALGDAAVPALEDVLYSENISPEEERFHVLSKLWAMMVTLPLDERRYLPLLQRPNGWQWALVLLRDAGRREGRNAAFGPALSAEIQRVAARALEECSSRGDAEKILRLLQPAAGVSDLFCRACRKLPAEEQEPFLRAIGSFYSQDAMNDLRREPTPQECATWLEELKRVRSAFSDKAGCNPAIIDLEARLKWLGATGK